MVQLERVSQHALLGGFAAADALRRRLTDGMAAQRVGDVVEDPAIPRRVEGSQRLSVGVHEALHALQRVQDGGVFRLHVPPTVKGKCGTAIGARNNLAEQRASLLGESNGCDVRPDCVPRERTEVGDARAKGRATREGVVTARSDVAPARRV